MAKKKDTKESKTLKLNRATIDKDVKKAGLTYGTIVGVIIVIIGIVLVLMNLSALLITLVGIVLVYFGLKMLGYNIKL